MKDQPTKVTKEYNWEIVVPDLRKFGIKINQDQRKEIINGNHKLISEILKQLNEYDQAIMSYPTVNGSPANKEKRHTTNNSEPNFDEQFGSLERARMPGMKVPESAGMRNKQSQSARKVINLHQMQR